MGCRMSLKVHILDQFKENMGAYSEEQGKRSHQDILDFERRKKLKFMLNIVFRWAADRNQLKYNTWKPGKFFLLQSAIKIF